MVTLHGKNLAAGLSKTHPGRHLMLKLFNVKQEQISLQQPRLPRQLPRRLPRLQPIPIHIASVKKKIHGYHVQIAILMLKPTIIFTTMTITMFIEMNGTHVPTVFRQNVILISSIEWVVTVTITSLCVV